MRKLGRIEGYEVTWSPPESDAGRGSGEVFVGGETTGKQASSEQAALETARVHIRTWSNKP